jgi:hypothetical protein
MFALIKKIKSIINYYGIGQVLYLVINFKNISNMDVADLMTLFTRYKFERVQLKVFMNESNKDWFEDNFS